MKAVLIDVRNKQIRDVHCDGTLENIYSLTGCRLIQPLDRKEMKFGSGVAKKLVNA